MPEISTCSILDAIDRGAMEITCPDCACKLVWIDMHLITHHAGICPFCKKKVAGISKTSAKRIGEHKDPATKMPKLYPSVFRHIRKCEGWQLFLAELALDL